MWLDNCEQLDTALSAVLAFQNYAHLAPPLPKVRAASNTLCCDDHFMLDSCLCDSLKEVYKCASCSTSDRLFNTRTRLHPNLRVISRLPSSLSFLIVDDIAESSPLLKSLPSSFQISDLQHCATSARVDRPTRPKTGRSQNSKESKHGDQQQGTFYFFSLLQSRETLQCSALSPTMDVNPLFPL